MIVGAVFYVVPLFLLLKINHTALSSYNGIGGITPAGLVSALPQNILKTYHYFGIYFLTDTLKTNRLQYFGAYNVLLLLFAVLTVLVGIKAWKVKKSRIILPVLAALATPVACNAYMLIAGDKLELQMAAGLAMLAPLIMIAAFSVIGEKRMPKAACVLFCVALVYGSSMQVWFDQEAMYEGRNASETMAAQVITDLKSEGLLSAGHEYFFVGVPAKNPLFSVSEAYGCANGYAQFGNFWTSGSCTQMSYKGLIGKHMGLDMQMSYSFYGDIERRVDISALPQFPNDGYISMIDEKTVIIKIGEYEKYSEYSAP